MTITLKTRPDYQPSGARLEGQRLLITGAASGLGKALASLAAAEGAELILLDRNLKALERLHDEIEAHGLAQPALYPLDLMGASPDDYTELADRIAESLGGLDALVHAAADIGEPAPIALYDPQAWLKCLHINVNAAFLLTQALLPLLRGSAGRILFVSDECGRTGQAAMGAYGVSKWAIEGLAAMLAAERSAAHPIDCCSVDPGAMRTALRRNLYAGEMAHESPLPDGSAAAMLELLDPTIPLANAQQYRVET